MLRIISIISIGYIHMSTQVTFLPECHCALVSMLTNTPAGDVFSFVLFLVLQLVKSQKEHIKLILETEKEKILRKEFVFENTKVTDVPKSP